MAVNEYLEVSAAATTSGPVHGLIPRTGLNTPWGEYVPPG